LDSGPRGSFAPLMVWRHISHSSHKRDCIHHSGDKEN